MLPISSTVDVSSGFPNVVTSSIFSVVVTCSESSVVVSSMLSIGDVDVSWDALGVDVSPSVSTS